VSCRSCCCIAYTNDHSTEEYCNKSNNEIDYRKVFTMVTKVKERNLTPNRYWDVVLKRCKECHVSRECSTFPAPDDHHCNRRTDEAKKCNSKELKEMLGAELHHCIYRVNRLFSKRIIDQESSLFLDHLLQFFLLVFRNFYSIIIIISTFGGFLIIVRFLG